MWTVKNLSAVFVAIGMFAFKDVCRDNQVIFVEGISAIAPYD